MPERRCCGSCNAITETPTTSRYLLCKPVIGDLKPWWVKRWRPGMQCYVRDDEGAACVAWMPIQESNP